MTTRIIICALIISCPSLGEEIPQCGTIQKIRKQSEVVEIRSECDESWVWVAEFKNNKQNGFSKNYTRSGKLKSHSYFIEDKKTDSSLVWDTLGNLVAKRFFKDDIQVGGDTGWSADGKIAYVKQFNDSGTPNGYWYRNYDEGHLEYEQYWAEGACTSHVEYYRNGKLRLKMSSPISSKDTFFGKMVTSAESYSWSGKRIGKVAKGKGKIFLLPRDFNDFAFPNYDGKPTVGYIEVYQDSNLVKVHQIDSAAIEKYR